MIYFFGCTLTYFINTVQCSAIYATGNALNFANISLQCNHNGRQEQGTDTDFKFQACSVTTSEDLKPRSFELDGNIQSLVISTKSDSENKYQLAVVDGRGKGAVLSICNPDFKLDNNESTFLYSIESESKHVATGIHTLK